VNTHAQLPKPIIDYMMTLTLRAIALYGLNATPDPVIRGVRVFDFPAVPGVFILEFHHDGVEKPSILKLFPVQARSDGVLLEFFDTAERGSPGLIEVTQSKAKRGYLSLAKACLDTTAADVRGISFPFDFEPAQEALKAGLTVSRAKSGSANELASPADAEVDHRETQTPPAQAASDDLEVSFTALAVDILSGSALRENASSENGVAYCVWADPDDKLATLILRFFDEGAAVAIAAYVLDQPHTELFRDRINALIDFFENPPADSTGPNRIAQILSGLSLLDETAACARLGLVMATHAQFGGELHEPGIYGKPSDETLERLDLLEAVSESPVWMANSNLPSAFEVIAHGWLKNNPSRRWTKPREDASESRIEVLEHFKYPGSAVLLLFATGEATPDVAVFLPQTTEVLTEEFTSALNHMMVDRRFGSSSKSLPLSPKSPFKMVPDEKAEQLLHECLENIEEGEGADLGFPADLLREGFEEAFREIFDQSAQEDSANPDGPSPAKLH
jgi:hypothetical protein